MIARLQGTVLDKGVDHTLLDVGGVGYRVNASLNTLAALPAVGSVAALRVHTHVREDVLELYGFGTQVEELVFHQLIATPNIGPKKAITILSGLPAEEIVAAVRDEDAARLARAHGVGKKTAERLVVELKDRFAKLSLEGTPAATPDLPAEDERVDALVGGLVNLGYKPEPAQRAAEAVLAEHADAEVPTLLREALKILRG